MDPHATAGRVVHYYPIDGVQNPIAAHVNRGTTEDGQAQLTVLEATGPRVIQRVMYSESPAPGCWSWMPYQRAKAASAEGNQSESAEPRPDVKLPEAFVEMNDVVHGLLERVGSLEDLHDGAAHTELPEPETETPPLINQAGREIDGDEEVPDAAPVDLGSAADNG